MRLTRFSIVCVLGGSLLVLGSGSALAGRLPAAAAASPRSSQIHIQIPIPTLGHVTLGVVKVHLTGAAAAHAPALLKLRLGSSRASPGAELLAAQHVDRSQASATYTILIAVVRGATVRHAIVQHGTRQPQDARGNPFLDWIIMNLYGKPPVDDVVLTDADVAAGLKAGFEAHLKSLFDSAVTWDPVKNPADLNDPDLDTGYYDDGHAFGWKMQTGPTPWVSDWAKLVAATGSDSAILDDLYRAAGVSPRANAIPPPSAGSTGTGPCSTGEQWQTGVHMAFAGAAAFQPTSIPASCRNVLSQYSIHIRGALGAHPYYYWHDGSAGPPVGEPSCGAVHTQSLNGWQVTGSLVAPGTPSFCPSYSTTYCVLVQYSGSGSTAPVPLEVSYKP